MALLQLINHLINRYIPSKLAIREAQKNSSKFHCRLSWNLKLEAKFFPKITSLVELFNVTGRTFFVGNLRKKRSVFPYFRTFLNLFGQNE